jgi:hypothetical protein
MLLLGRFRGNDHHAALRALAYKWIRILFRCWKDRKPYDEQKYIQSLRRTTVREWNRRALFQHPVSSSIQPKLTGCVTPSKGEASYCCTTSV